MRENVSDGQHAVNAVRGTRTPEAEAFSRFAVQALRVASQLQSAGDELARPAGQTAARWRVLAAVEEAPSPVAQVARALGLARQSVQRVADALTRDGLCRYAENPAHQRAKLLAMTDAGRDALARVQAAQRGWAHALGTDAGIVDLAHATTLLERIGALLQAAEAEGTGG
jgi:DNA-binding MarR family transcriptional regulator